MYPNRLHRIHKQFRKVVLLTTKPSRRSNGLSKACYNKTQTGSLSYTLILEIVPNKRFCLLILLPFNPVSPRDLISPVDSRRSQFFCSPSSLSQTTSLDCRWIANSAICHYLITVGGRSSRAPDRRPPSNWQIHLKFDISLKLDDSNHFDSSTFGSSVLLAVLRPQKRVEDNERRFL